MNSCEKVAIICNKAQYHEATLLEKLQLKFHVLMCKRCSKYTKKNSKLSTLCDKANLQALSKADKMSMKENLGKTN
jgi:hypothetical protein